MMGSQDVMGKSPGGSGETELDHHDVYCEVI